jgi:hypothetical protein
MKRIVVILLMLSILLVFLPQVAFANSPGPKFDGSVDPKPATIITVVVGYVLIVGFTCFVEWLVSIPFKMHEECAKVILLTNVLTQVVMHALELLFLLAMAVFPIVWLTFPIVVFALEIIVYFSEFLIYKDKMLGFPTWQIFLYTMLANTASLLLGLLIIS